MVHLPLTQTPVVDFKYRLHDARKALQYHPDPRERHACVEEDASGGWRKEGIQAAFQRAAAKPSGPVNDRSQAGEIVDQRNGESSATACGLSNERGAAIHQRQNHEGPDRKSDQDAQDHLVCR
jgi:hypothetical protein